MKPRCFIYLTCPCFHCTRSSVFLQQTLCFPCVTLVALGARPKVQTLPQRAHGPQNPPEHQWSECQRQFLLLLTGLFVSVAPCPCLPIGSFPFLSPRFLFFYFFLNMLPTFLPLRVLLLILAVLFGIGIPTRLTSGRKGVNQAHGLMWQETCPSVLLVLSLLCFPEMSTSWSGSL